MGRESFERLALIVRTAPYRGRSGRDQLDVALAAAALDRELELFFIGAGVLQLLPPGSRDAARLPAGSRGWASLPDLTTVRVWVAPGMRQRLAGAGQEPLLPCSELEPAAMAKRLAACARAWVI